MSAVLAEHCSRCKRSGAMCVRGTSEWGAVYRLCAYCLDVYRSLQLNSKALENFANDLWRQAPHSLETPIERTTTTFSRV
jgi:hypothetical protein